MKIDYDPAKRDLTLTRRGLDMARAEEVFENDNLTFPDLRADYGEDRRITFGYLDERLIVMVWTVRGTVRRIISLRKANEREQERHAGRLGRPR